MFAAQRFSALALVASSLSFACSSDSDEPRSGAAGSTSTSGASSGGSIGVAGSSGAAGGSSGGVAGGSGGSAQAGSGTSGSAGTTGGVPQGGASAGGAGAGGSVSGTAGTGGGVTLEPCAEPSVSHLKVWEMQVVSGTQVPATGSPLRAYAGGHELYVEWTLQGGGYGTANAPLENMGEYANGATPGDHGVDISAGPGITIEYSSTGNTYLQIRSASVPHGGDHFRADLPSTEGMMKSITLPLDAFRRPGGSTPPGDDVLKDAFSFTFVGGGSTKLGLRQVLIPGFVPPCN